MRLTAAPKGTPSILNCTVPVGVPLPGETTLTVAVNVTGCPKTEGLVLDVTVVVVLALLTVIEKLFDAVLFAQLLFARL